MPSKAAPLSVTAITGTAALGGAERVLLDFANRAFEHDIALRVLTPLDGPLVSILNKIGVPAEVISAPPTLTGALRSERWYSPRALAGMYQWSRRLARHPFATGADVTYTVAYRAHLAARLAGLAPVVWHLHSFPPKAARQFWHVAVRERPVRLIANSEAVADAWRHGLNRPSERLRVVHNGVNLDRFRPRERTGWIHEQLGIPASHRLIGMPSVFARWKGHLEVLEAFEDIAAEFPDVHLVIVGGAIYQTDEEQSLGHELKRATGEFRVVTSGAIPADTNEERQDDGTADETTGKGAGGSAYARPELGSPPGVHMLPFQREIELAYPEFDLTVHYSLQPEPFGRVVLESMACAVPIVAASEGGPVEIMGNGVEAQSAGGWLVEPRNPKALTSMFRRVLARPADELRSIGAAGRLRAEDHFSSRAFAGRVAAVLQEAYRG